MSGSADHRARLIAGIEALMRRLPGSVGYRPLREPSCIYSFRVHLHQEHYYRSHVGILATVTHESFANHQDGLTAMTVLALYAREYDLAFGIMSLVAEPSTGELPAAPSLDLMVLLLAPLLLNRDPEVLPHVRRMMTFLPCEGGGLYYAGVRDMAWLGNLVVIRELMDRDSRWYTWKQRRCGTAILAAILYDGDFTGLDLEAIAHAVRCTGSTMDAVTGCAAAGFGLERVQRRLVSLGNIRVLEALWRVAPSALRLDWIAQFATEWKLPSVRAWAIERAAGPGAPPDDTSDPYRFAATLRFYWPNPTQYVDFDH